MSIDPTNPGDLHPVEEPEPEPEPGWADEPAAPVEDPDSTEAPPAGAA